MKRSTRKAPTLGELQNEAQRLESRASLWNHPEFQRFVTETETAIDRLEKAQWFAGNEDLQVALREIGVSTPGDNLLTLFLCTRSVVHSWRKRLRPYREAEGNLNSIKKELDRNG